MVPTDSDIRKFVEAWYRKLDVHVPMVELLPLLADDGLEMVFPEATVRGHAGFEGWYQRVIRIFFDEVHEVTRVDIDRIEGGANLTIVVHWQASVWNPPAPNSARINLDAYQRWVVRFSPPTGQTMVTTYVVDSLEYREGSAKL
jgi:hypothetical protein